MLPCLCRVAKAVLQRCEVALKADLQKFLMRLILAPISSNSELTSDPCVLVAEVGGPWGARTRSDFVWWWT